jgi:hypothetical protein
VGVEGRKEGGKRKRDKEAKEISEFGDRVRE